MLHILLDMCDCLFFFFLFISGYGNVALQTIEICFNKNCLKSSSWVCRSSFAILYEKKLNTNKHVSGLKELILQLHGTNKCHGCPQ